MRMRMTLKFNEELANEDINKDYYPNFGKALRKIASYEWAYVYLKEWTWNANYYHDNVLNTLKKYKNYLCEKSAN